MVIVFKPIVMYTIKILTHGLSCTKLYIYKFVAYGRNIAMKN